ncbi:hypothetical protein TVAG_135960 [Trichomonas vaginalis G3]|uniref:Uncharacterized protein n=1 Tax=Trichomonas vaginalis (strain ATCC PRA-98 / G3) TaxID=412133 RepID=A2DJ78_TRIV3|nr:armadillo (ARM) repeat-containing protein family [Trichomonas vaginalis G3]EAY19465.1 hypothetical protein TVAG_135960 [Trichomonas vaginalis G3]KAI5520056.1 armadillo (ARM) repeat-containing protein family [Trichomonas vaginalis G3]|eukprot:XP_001580451.1 hypothetical protein [Trichomonas vaginalis G3]
MNDYKNLQEDDQNEVDNTDQKEQEFIVDSDALFMSDIEQIDLYNTQADFLSEMKVLEHIIELFKEGRHIPKEVFPYPLFFDCISNYLANSELQNFYPAIVVTNSVIHDSNQEEIVPIFENTQCYRQLIDIFLNSIDYYDEIIQTFTILIQKKEISDFLIEKGVFDRIDIVFNEEGLMTTERLFFSVQFLAQLTKTISVEDVGHINAMAAYFVLQLDPEVNGLTILDQCAIGLSNFFQMDLKKETRGVAIQYDIVPRLLNIINKFGPSIDEMSVNLTNTALFIFQSIFYYPTKKLLESLDDYPDYLFTLINCARHFDQEVAKKGISILANLMLDGLIEDEEINNSEIPLVLQFSFEDGNYKLKLAALSLASAIIQECEPETIKNLFNPVIVQKFVETMIYDKRIDYKNVLISIQTLLHKADLSGILDPVVECFQTEEFNEYLHEIDDNCDDEKLSELIMEIVRALHFDEE